MQILKIILFYYSQVHIQVSKHEHPPNVPIPSRRAGSPPQPEPQSPPPQPPQSEQPHAGVLTPSFSKGRIAPFEDKHTRGQRRLLQRQPISVAHGHHKRGELVPRESQGGPGQEERPGRPADGRRLRCPGCWRQ